MDTCDSKTLQSLIPCPIVEKRYKEFEMSIVLSFQPLIPPLTGTIHANKCFYGLDLVKSFKKA